MGDAVLTMRLAVVALVLAGCSWAPRPTVMSLCWDADGRAHYPERGAANTRCPAPEPFQWAGPHRRVYFDSDGGTYEPYRDSFQEALHFWNFELGRIALTRAGEGDSVDIYVRFGDADREDTATTTHLRFGGYVTESTIEIHRPGDTRQMYLVIAHELGHAAFGLAHDTGSSIMNPACADEGDVMNAWIVTSEDRAAVLSMLSGG